MGPIPMDFPPTMNPPGWNSMIRGKGPDPSFGRYRYSFWAGDLDA